MFEEGCLLRMGMAIHERSSESIGFFVLVRGGERSSCGFDSGGGGRILYHLIMDLCARENFERTLLCAITV